MTQEQFNRAMEINNQMSKLQKLKEDIINFGITFQINKKDFHVRLGVVSIYDPDSILNIFKRNINMIHEGLDAEIEKLKKEIEEL